MRDSDGPSMRETNEYLAHIVKQNDTIIELLKSIKDSLRTL